MKISSEAPEFSVKCTANRTKKFSKVFSRYSVNKIEEESHDKLSTNWRNQFLAFKTCPNDLSSMYRTNRAVGNGYAYSRRMQKLIHYCMRSYLLGERT